MTGITRDELMQMMIRHGFKRAPVIWHHMGVDQDGVIALVNDVLERAAVECESGVNADDDWDSFYWDDACINRALAIRSLKINTGD